MEAEVNVDVRQEMLDELEGFRIEAVALERVVGFDQAEAISHDDMRARYTQKD